MFSSGVGTSLCLLNAILENTLPRVLPLVPLRICIKSAKFFALVTTSAQDC